MPVDVGLDGERIAETRPAGKTDGPQTRCALEVDAGAVKGLFFETIAAARAR